MRELEHLGALPHALRLELGERGLQIGDREAEVIDVDPIEPGARCVIERLRVVKAQQMGLLARRGGRQGHDHVIGLEARHAHVSRELLALDHHGIGHLEAQHAKETLGAIEIAHAIAT